LKAVAGEIDMQGRHVRTQDIPTLMENRDRGNYDVFLWPYCGGTVASAYFNQTYKGPESVVTTNLKFREALSVATDREEINQTVYQGLGIAGQSVPPSTVGGYPGDDVRDYLTTYDLTDAVARLDALVASGELGAKDSDGYYTLPDGAPLKLILDAFDGFGSWTQVLEPLAQQWKEAGINAEPFPGPRPIIDDRTTSNEMMVRVEWMETACNTFEGRARTNIDNLWAPLWVRWVKGSDGGEEPPAWAIELKEMHERAPSLDQAGRNALEKELYSPSWWLFTAVTSFNPANPQRSPKVIDICSSSSLKCITRCLHPLNTNHHFIRCGAIINYWTRTRERLSINTSFFPLLCKRLKNLGPRTKSIKCIQY
jgi:peptide/nickel transport system substrate-binding protein